MSKSNNSEGGFIGKIGGTVVYQSNGQWVKRSIGVITKPPTIAQLACREKMRLVTACLKPVKALLPSGFIVPKNAKGITAYNLACRYNLNHAVTGEYPEMQIDYAKVLFAEGAMPVVTGCKAEISDKGIRFSWGKVEDSKLIRWNDQVMLIAYLPDELDAKFQICAAARKEGEAFLPLPKYRTPVVLETYLSFVSANHKLTSNSIYTGQLNWSNK
jgi:hypothetical protein